MQISKGTNNNLKKYRTSIFSDSVYTAWTNSYCTLRNIIVFNGKKGHSFIVG